MKCNKCDSELVHISGIYICRKCGLRFRYFGATSYCILMMDIDSGMIYEFPYENESKPKFRLFGWIKRKKK